MSQLYVLIAGQTQAGSTRIFNFLRLFFGKGQNLTVKSIWVEQFLQNVDTVYEEDVILCKCHDYDERLLPYFDKIILPIRDPRDAVISSKKRFWSNTDNPIPVSIYVNECRNNISRFNAWRENATNPHVFKYESYNVKTLSELSLYLSVNIQVAEDMIISAMGEVALLQTSDDLPDQDNFDSETYQTTLLSKAHDTSGGKSKKYLYELSYFQLVQIQKDEMCRKFLDEFGYDQISIDKHKPLFLCNSS